jgi:UPF0755 protein
MKRKKIIYGILLLLLLIAGFLGWKIFGPTVSAPEGKYFYIKTGENYSEVKAALLDQKIISGDYFFDLLARRLKYANSVKPGRYEIKGSMSIYSLVRMLRLGNQSPVNLVITKLRTKEDLAQKIGNNFECDSLDFINILNNDDSLRKYGLDTNIAMTAVIPNTYSILWNSSASKIFKKLFAEKEKFWNAERMKKANALNMTPDQVYTMASIVEEETNKEEDKGNIASVYLNRIHSGQRLEADPTIKFALRNFGLKRIRSSHIDAAKGSPYNTYFNKGLPPGPICTPSSKTIDAVLNAPATNYLFFVARPDRSGLSNFTSSYEEHMINAKNYQRYLDSINIK